MIYVGTSGFSYDDWKGHFYPEKLAKKDMLAYYAKAFSCVEINSTYYAIPAASSFASMAAKTPDDFRFIVKAHKDMTHTQDPQQQSFEYFLNAIEPLRDSGKLGGILAQFPWSFKFNPENMNKLEEFRNRVGDLNTVIEFRNSEWVNQEVFDQMKELRFGYCCVDEPQIKGLMPGIALATSNTGYVRFHGRNAQKWYEHENAYERYNYRYSEEELQEWVPKVQDIETHTSDIYIMFNNHYQGKSADNARMFAKMLNIPLPMEELVSKSQLSFIDDF